MGRTGIIVGFGLLVSFLFFGCGQSSSQSSGAQAVDDAWRKAVLANDLEAVMACYSKDAVMWLPGAPEAKGSDAIRSAYTGLFNVNTVKEAMLSNTHYENAGNFSVGWGNFSLTLLPKSGGNPTMMSGRFTVVAKQEGDKWVYVVDHASSPAAPPEQPKQ
jgi:uncharacterized protein (TIGR02246 family)